MINSGGELRGLGDPQYLDGRLAYLESRLGALIRSIKDIMRRPGSYLV